MLSDQHRSDTISRPFSEATSRRPDHDEFKLHFPVPKDRTMRRIALIQIFSLLAIPTSCVGNAFFLHMAKVGETGLGKPIIDNSSPYVTCSMIAMTILFLSIIVIFGMSFVHSFVMTRRYGWRAMQDPIEAHRVAVREGLADALTAANTRQPEDSRQIDHQPIRRLRPITARRQ